MVGKEDSMREMEIDTVSYRTSPYLPGRERRVGGRRKEKSALRNVKLNSRTGKPNRRRVGRYI